MARGTLKWISGYGAASLGNRRYDSSRKGYQRLFQASPGNMRKTTDDEGSADAAPPDAVQPPFNSPILGRS